MTTVANKKRLKNVQPQATNSNIDQIDQSIITESDLDRIPIALIDLNPNNYRKTFKPGTVEELADDLIRHGMISSLTIRPMPEGRYQLVAGERRYRAAKLAKLQKVPALIRVLTDEQVTEIQLAENLQREDPHPLNESQAVALLQETGKSIAEIAVRLGKSEAFVYNRIKLSKLVEAIQEVFLSDKISMQDALEIAALSADSQQEFFNNFCKDWQKNNFQVRDVRYYVNRYKYDLKQAPFDIKDKNLIPDAGACGGCPFNTATLKSLFPELAKESKCTNMGCFKNKCIAHLETGIRKAVAAQPPAGIIISGNLSEETRIVLDSLPETAGILQYSRHDLTIFTAPNAPDKEDYTQSWGIEEGEEPEFYQEGYDQALQEYETDFAEYQVKLSEGNTPKGLLIENNQCRLVPFSLEKPITNANGNKPTTAKQVQEAIKAGTATPELLNAEIERIKKREQRAKELDSEKIQAAIHEQFSQSLKQETATWSLTAADLAAIRLLVYQSLDWSTKNIVDKALFKTKKSKNQSENEYKYEVLTRLTDEQFSFLIGTAVAGKSESKIPGHINAICLYRVAEAAALNIKEIEKSQGVEAKVRATKQALRIKELEQRIAKLQLNEAA